MSILTSNSLRKSSQTDSHRTEEKPVCEEVPEGHFKELLQVERVAEELREKNFFAMVSEEEEEESHQADEIVNVAIHSNQVCSNFISSAETGSANSIAAVAATELSVEMEALFEKMASCMIVMNASNDIETTLFLDSANFASSSLFGTQITIKEFSTAPKAFNVEIISNPNAAAMIDAGKNSLLSHFQKGNFNFSVHRLDTHIAERADKPVFHRKESVSDEQKGDSGQ